MGKEVKRAGGRRAEEEEQEEDYAGRVPSQLPGARVAAAAGKQTPPEAPRLARTHGAGSPALRWELACLSTDWPGPQSLPS